MVHQNTCLIVEILKENQHKDASLPENIENVLLFLSGCFINSKYKIIVCPEFYTLGAQSSYQYTLY